MIFVLLRGYLVSRFLDFLASVTESDLQEIDDRITVLDTELNLLREIRKVVAIKCGAEKPRKWGGPRKKSAGETAAAVPAEAAQPQAVSVTRVSPRETPAKAEPSKEETVLERNRRHAKSYIMANGPTPMPELTRKCGIHAASIKAVVNHPWFVATPQGIQVTR